jgi:hypothetical protein
MLTFRRSVLALTATGALALAGCAGTTQSNQSDGSNDPLTRLRSNASASLQEAVAKTEQAKSVAFTTEGTAAGKTANGSGQIAFGPPVQAEVMMNTLGIGPLSVRLIDTVLYAQIPQQQQETVGGKKWFKLDLAQIAKAGGFDAEQFTNQIRNANPTTQLKTLLDSGKLTVVGDEKVDGTPTVHYTGTVPVASYLKQQDEKARALVEQQLTKAGIKDVTTDLWVDAAYQLRKSRMVMKSTAASTDLTTVYRDYGKPVQVTAPPAADVSDLAGLIRNGAA